MRRTEYPRWELAYLIRMYTKALGTTPSTLLYRLLLTLSADKMYGDGRLYELLSRNPVVPAVWVKGKGVRLIGKDTVIKRFQIMRALEKTVRKAGEVNMPRGNGEDRRIFVTIRKSHGKKMYETFVKAKDRSELLQNIFLFLEALSEETGVDLIEYLFNMQEETRKAEVVNMIIKKLEEEERKT